jgi:hypothetical protein
MQDLKKVLILSILSFAVNCHARKAFVIVPVTDLVGEPIKTFGLAKTNRESYDKIAISYVDMRKNNIDSSYGAPRLHQLLFNEIVDIIAEPKSTHDDEDEVCISIESAFFVTSQIKKPQSLFFTKKKNILSFEKLATRNLSGKYIPETPSFKNPLNKPTNPTIGLIKPFFDPVTQQTYSIGTRFIYDPQQTTNTDFDVHIFDRSSTNFKQTCIPKEFAKEIIFESKEEAVACFVSLVKSWAHCKGIIPYVWGGYSYTHCSPDFGFKEVARDLVNGTKVIVHERSNLSEKPFTGFDCAGIIFRAAQLCSIPYFFKNTYTLAYYLKSLGIEDQLHEGDLIWIKGHVMIVSDIPNNKLIEARGYDHDFGYVQEISLEKVFKGIKTYKQLLHAYAHHESIIRLNKSGKSVETINSFKLLKLKSVWDHATYGHS